LIISLFWINSSFSWSEFEAQSSKPTISQWRSTSMFADPQSVTINSVAKSMPRVETNGRRTIYRGADGVWTLTISHQEANKRVRTMTRLDQIAIVPDPLTSVNDYETLSTYNVIDRPQVGFTTTQVQQQVAGLNAWQDATAVAKLVGGES
jgi:hypothetical protein